MIELVSRQEQNIGAIRSSQFGHMPPDADNALVLFPGALGDFICFLPTLAALRARHRGALLVCAKPTLLELLQLPHTATASIDRREIADLFVSDAPASLAARQLFGGFEWVYSWTGYGNPCLAQRLANLTGGQANVYHFRGMDVGEHAVDYFARCAGVTPCSSVGVFLAEDTPWFDRFKRQHHLARPFVLIHAGSGAAKKNWQGFEAAVRECRERYGLATIILRGPAETEQAHSDYGADIIADRLSLPQVVALLRRSRCYLGNDSGISHLAGAAGAAGVVLFGPTDPATWAPYSDRLRSLHAPHPCPQCGSETFCPHRLPVSTVVDALGAVLGS
jgi:heptosyltransferase III